MTRRLIKEVSDVEISISLTTRPQRQGEENGVHYWFVDKDAFQKSIDRQDFLEWAEVFGNFYGTTFNEIERIRAKGHRIILEIDVQGWESIKKTIPTAQSVFILPPSLKTLWERLTSRGTDSLEVRWKRLITAKQELNSAASFEHFIINDDLEKSYAELKNLVSLGRPVSLSRELGIKHNQTLLSEFETAPWLKEIKALSKNLKIAPKDQF